MSCSVFLMMSDNVFIKKKKKRKNHLIGLSCFSYYWKLRLCEVYICRDYNSWWNTLHYRFLFNAHDWRRNTVNVNVHIFYLNCSLIKKKTVKSQVFSNSMDCYTHSVILYVFYDRITRLILVYWEQSGGHRPVWQTIQHSIDPCDKRYNTAIENAMN